MPTRARHPKAIPIRGVLSLYVRRRPRILVDRCNQGSGLKALLESRPAKSEEPNRRRAEPLNPCTQEQPTTHKNADLETNRNPNTIEQIVGANDRRQKLRDA